MTSVAYLNAALITEGREGSEGGRGNRRSRRQQRGAGQQKGAKVAKREVNHGRCRRHGRVAGGGRDDVLMRSPVQAAPCACPASHQLDDVPGKDGHENTPLAESR